MKILVCSFGGVASKSFIKGVVMSANRQIPWLHGHYRVPPPSMESDVRVIYLFGNPLNAVLSFFNRREARSSLHGFSGQADPTPNKAWAQSHCRNLDGDWQSLDPGWDLAAYLEQGRDLFRLEEHFDNWADATRPYPILLLKYETLWEHLGAVFDFLGIDNPDLSRFPPRQQRASDWTALPEPIRDRLYGVYGGFQERLSGFDDVRVLHPT